MISDRRVLAMADQRLQGAMTTLLEKARAEPSKLAEQEQEAIAAPILAELESYRRWDDLFARSQGLLAMGQRKRAANTTPR
jgi:hypothetical protein